MRTRNSSISWSRCKRAPQAKDNHETFCKRILTNQIDNKLMFAFPMRRQIMSFRRVIYRIGSFYKKVTGHSFFLSSWHFWDIRYIWRESVGGLLLRISWQNNVILLQKRKFYTSSLLLWQWTTSYCRALKDFFLCHPGTGEERVSKSCCY